MPKRILKKLGYRGTALLNIGIMLTAYGASMLIYPSPTLASGELLHRELPAWIIGLQWVICGSVAALCGLIHNSVSKKVGYIAAVLPPTVLGASYLASWIIWLLPLAVPGYYRGWGGALLMFGFAVLILIHAAQPEPHGIKEEDPE